MADTDKAEQLFEAVNNNDKETTVNLLQDVAGRGMCQALDLAKAAKAKDPEEVDYSILSNLENNSETLTMYKQTYAMGYFSGYVYSDLPVAGVTQKSCKR